MIFLPKFKTSLYQKLGILLFASMVLNTGVTFFRYTEPYLLFKPQFWPPLMISTSWTQKTPQADLYRHLLPSLALPGHALAPIVVITDAFAYFEYELILVPYPTRHYLLLHDFLTEGPPASWVLVEKLQLLPESVQQLQAAQFEQVSANTQLSLWRKKGAR